MTSATQFPAGTWQIDPGKTTVTITVKKMGFITVPATLGVNTGTIQVAGNGTVTAVDVALDASSYKSKNHKRNEHVVSSDFLDADTFPTISFHADAVTPSGSGYNAAGTVTIKGQPSPVVLTVSNVVFDDAKGTFTASADVDRKAIGVGKMPTFVIAQNLELAIQAAATKAS